MASQWSGCKFEIQVETEKVVKGLAFLGLLEDGRGGKEPGCDLTPLNEHNSEVYPLWKDAKDIWKRNRDRADWLEMIAHPYPSLPFDLIDWLSGKPHITDERRSYLESRGMTSEPAVIALEHAARLCGAEEFSFSINYLKRKRMEQRKAKR